MCAMSQRDIQTKRLRVHVREAGSGSTPVLLVHGNCSSAAFFDELMLDMPPGYRAIAPDLRGYGETEPLPIDATRGLGDWADDLHSLVEALGLDRVHLLGWSMGGGIILHYALQHPARVASLTLVSPMSPYGFGGTRDAAGTPTAPDFACSGGGVVSPDFVKSLQAGEQGAENPNSARNVLNLFYVKPPFRGAAEQEDRWVDSILSTRIGTAHYPGDLSTSPNWPGAAPGVHGVANAMSPKYCNVSAFAGIKPQPPVCWVRGDSDQIVSDTSFFDLAFLGSVGYVPGWPGADTCPPQPMVTQTRTVLDAYRAAGGHYEEHVLLDCGHSPFPEQPAAFQQAFFAFLDPTRR